MNTEKQNYKIKVANEAESREVCELFCFLGYTWDVATFPRFVGQKVIATEDREMRFGNLHISEYKDKWEITLPQLRDLVVLHRNDVSDATHKHKKVESDKYYKACDEKFYHFSETGHWNYVGDTANDVVSRHVIPNDQEIQMTLEDAMREFAKGKEIEALDADGWHNLNKWAFINIKYAKAYRIAPQRKNLNGNYTKEELLKIAGEMA